MSGWNRGFPVPGDVALTADGRDLQLVSGRDKVAQNIKVRSQIFKGSWRYDRQRGLTYFEDILAFGASQALVRRRFYDLLAQTPGVLSVQQLSIVFDRAQQTILVSFEVLSDTGEVVRDVLNFTPLR